MVATERIMQATGNPIYYMFVQGAGALINIIFDPILIFGWFGLPAMGVTCLLYTSSAFKREVNILMRLLLRSIQTPRHVLRSSSVCGNRLIDPFPSLPLFVLFSRRYFAPTKTL